MDPSLAQLASHLLSPMATDYKELRSTYDLAFHQLGRQQQYVNELQVLGHTENHVLVAAQQELAAAQYCYLRARNALAGYLLSRQAEERAPVHPESFTEPSCVSC